MHPIPTRVRCGAITDYPRVVHVLPPETGWAATAAADGASEPGPPSREEPDIATSDPRLAVTTLDCLARSGVVFAVLHGEHTVAHGGARSDVDIAVAAPPEEILAAAGSELAGADLHPVMIWPYDVRSASIFVTTAAADDGCQIDVVYDTVGESYYGIRADRILEAAVRGERWPAACTDHELVYLIRKRLRKQQFDRVDELTAVARSMDSGRLHQTVRNVFDRWTADLVLSVIEGTTPPSRWPRLLSRAWAQSGRVVERFRRPTGFWVSVDGSHAPESARLIEARFGRIVPRAQAIPAAGPMIQRAMSISKARLRAAVLASWGPIPRGLNPDIGVVADGEEGVEDSLREVVRAMERSLRR